MAKVHFTVTCIATYESELPIPKDIANDKNAVLAYIHENLENACIADLQWSNDLDPDEAVILDDIKNIDMETNMFRVYHRSKTHPQWKPCLSESFTTLNDALKYKEECESWKSCDVHGNLFEYKVVEMQ
jgi:hypothetical protein|nr:MAG TPA: hypothetical protein [Bacteriophage sp.]DAF25699.1 MAG TPA: hypothetical protein [Caudoviricetes sp.]DAQ69205.1 MAG TPA: hypothetical protein [Caudoviricetes sp.]